MNFPVCFQHLHYEACLTFSYCSAERTLDVLFILNLNGLVGSGKTLQLRLSAQRVDCQCLTIVNSLPRH